MESLIALLGPTAVGKSALAMELAVESSGELVNADALQLYRGLDIGTAKPSPADRAAVPHHLIDIVEPGECCSAGAYAVLARQAVRAIQARGCLPVLVGGSGFYLQATLDGLGAVPPASTEIRSRLRSRLLEDGLAPLVLELARVDPESHARIPPGDSQRVLRALEVWELTGEALSSWHRRSPIGRDALPAWRIGLTLPRTLLYHRIETRVHGMLAAGWVDEIRSLLASGVSSASPAFQAIGYRQLAAHLEGRSSFDEAVAETIKATRHFAKRQETWFRRDERIRWFDARDIDSVRSEVRTWLANQGVGARA